MKWYKDKLKKKKPKLFNLNDYVWVQVTEQGKELRAQDYKLLTKHTCPALSELNGWSKWQLHDLMKTFGKYCSICISLPFKTNISLEDPNE